MERSILYLFDNVNDATSNAEKYVNVMEYPMAVSLNMVTFIYGPNDETDSVEVSKAKLMDFSFILKGTMLADASI